MSTSDRKQRILDHIARSSAGLSLVSSKSTPTPTSETVTPQPAIEPVKEVKGTSTSPEERKRRVLGHVEQSSSGFGPFSLEKSDTKKSRVLEHLRKSLSSQG